MQLLLPLGIFILGYVAVASAGEESPWDQIHVQAGELGTIVGAKVITSRKGEEYYTFTGIPYADPNSYTKRNRFKPSSIWTGHLNGPDALPDDLWYADKFASICPQRAILELSAENKTQLSDLVTVLNATSASRRENMMKLQGARKAGIPVDEVRETFGSLWGTEDCLTLNINVPADILDTPGEELPVIVYFHGGGADSVFSSVFMGLRLMERRVILVTANYRLGILGAFNMGVDEAPGCAGPYDGITSMEWLQKYIAYFGGDPNQVTVTGQSAGAMMATQLFLSPLTTNEDGTSKYFKRVIGFSGSALSVWATAVNPSINHHLKVAHLAKCYDGTSEPNTDEIVECMKNAPIQDLVDALDIYEEDEMFLGRLGFDARMPSIQAETLTIPKFMPKHPLEVLKNQEQSKDVDLMLGATKHDGSYPLDDIYVYYLEPNGLLEDENYMQNEMLPELLAMLGLEDPSRSLYHSFVRQYLGESANTVDFDSKMPGLIDMSTIFGFKAGQYRMIEEHAKVNPKSYFYSFDYVGRWTLYEVLQGFNKKIPGGIAHTDDQIYLFWMGPTLNEDARVTERFMDYVVNFAKYGNPNGNVEKEKEFWHRHDAATHPYFSINKVDRSLINARSSWINASVELFPVEEDESTDIPTTATENIPTSPATDAPTTTAVPIDDGNSASITSATTFLVIAVLAIFNLNM